MHYPRMAGLFCLAALVPVLAGCGTGRTRNAEVSAPPVQITPLSIQDSALALPLQVEWLAPDETYDLVGGQVYRGAREWHDPDWSFDAFDELDSSTWMVTAGTANKREPTVHKLGAAVARPSITVRLPL